MIFYRNALIKSIAVIVLVASAAASNAAEFFGVWDCNVGGLPVTLVAYKDNGVVISDASVHWGGDNEAQRAHFTFANNAWVFSVQSPGAYAEYRVAPTRKGEAVLVFHGRAANGNPHGYQSAGRCWWVP